MKNKKKYTFLRRRLSVLSVLIPCFLLFGCAKDITPPVTIPASPIKRESVIPQFTKVNDGIDSTIKANDNIKIKLDDQNREFKAQQLTITETINEAEQLLKLLEDASYLPKNHVTNIIDNLHKIEARNLFLETQNVELEAIRKEQAEVLRMTKEDASVTYRKLLDKETEVDELRRQNDFLASNLTTKNNEVVTLQQKLEKEKVKSAKATVYRNWVIGLAVGFILWLIIKNVLMIYFPMTKFRI